MFIEAMDAYSVSYTSPSRRGSSRIYQDLKTIRLHSIVQLEPDQLIRSLQILSEAGGVRKPLLLVTCMIDVLTLKDELTAEWLSTANPPVSLHSLLTAVHRQSWASEGNRMLA